jgi:hypothetical protein
MTNPTNTSPPQSATEDPESDTVDVQVFRAINVGTAGYVYVDMADGQSNVRHFVAAGIAYPCVGKRVRVTGTTATNITVLR